MSMWKRDDAESHRKRDAYAFSLKLTDVVLAPKIRLINDGVRQTSVHWRYLAAVVGFLYILDGVLPIPTSR